MDIYSLSRKWKELVDKARAKQLQPQEYNTGTFRWFFFNLVSTRRLVVHLHLYLRRKLVYFIQLFEKEERNMMREIPRKLEKSSVK